MRSAIFTSIAVLSGLAASTLIPGYVGTCYDGSTCCTNPAARLFRRTSCNPNKICCEEKKQPKFNTLTELKCGKSNVKSSTVLVTVSQCPIDTTQDCLHVYYAPFGDGTQYTEYHLQLSSNAITSSTPGKFTFTDTCRFGTDNLSIDCYVPLTRIATTVYGNPTLDFCTKPHLYIAAHAVEGTETCWAGTTPIDQNPANWAKYFDGYFLDCETICKKECTCPCPPDQSKYCNKGTGFAFNDKCSKEGNDCAYQLIDLGCEGQRWGWWSEIPNTDAQYDFELIEGAGDNYYSKGTSVGNVHVSVHDQGVDVSYSMKQTYAINVAHIGLTCFKPVTEAIDPTNGLKAKQNDYPCAPGKYTFNSGCLGNLPGYSTSLSKPTTGCEGNNLYLIFHAEVTEKRDTSDSCTAVPACVAAP